MGPVCRGTAWNGHGGRATSSGRRASSRRRLAALPRHRGRATPACARRRDRPGGIVTEEVAAAGLLRHWGGRAPPARSSAGRGGRAPGTLLRGGGRALL